jgi:hypothetical protein
LEPEDLDLEQVPDRGIRQLLQQDPQSFLGSSLVQLSFQLEGFQLYPPYLGLVSGLAVQAADLLDLAGEQGPVKHQRHPLDADLAWFLDSSPQARDMALYPESFLQVECSQPAERVINTQPLPKFPAILNRAAQRVQSNTRNLPLKSGVNFLLELRLVFHSAFTARQEPDLRADFHFPLLGRALEDLRRRRL